MRQLEVILAQCRTEAGEHYETHLDKFQNFLSRDEVVTLNSSFRRLDKLEEMYKILTILESYLERPSLDGRMDRQDLRKQLNEMLDNL
jgi:DNA integrity scanning protein DisA with diadenylate cyclase activity